MKGVSTSLLTKGVPRMGLWGAPFIPERTAELTNIFSDSLGNVKISNVLVPAMAGVVLTVGCRNDKLEIGIKSPKDAVWEG